MKIQNTSTEFGGEGWMSRRVFGDKPYVHHPFEKTKRLLVSPPISTLHPTKVDNRPPNQPPSHPQLSAKPVIKLPTQKTLSLLVFASSED
jgi:hypothetical protein